MRKMLRTVGPEHRAAFVTMEAIEPRLLLAEVHFIGGQGSAGKDFNHPSNWDSGKIPGVNDDAVINAPCNLSGNNSDSVHSITVNKPFIVSGASLNVDGGNITAKSKVTLAGGTISNAALITGAGGSFVINGSPTFDNVTLGTNLTVPGGSELNLKDVFNLNGHNLTLAHDDDNAALNGISGNHGANIAGPGQIIFAGNSVMSAVNNIFATGTSHGFVIESRVTVTGGFGVIDANTNFTNEGKFEFDDGGGLTVQSEGSAAFYNYGTMSFTDGGHLTVHKGVFSNRGTINVDGNKSSIFDGAAFQNGDNGKVNLTNGAQFTAFGGYNLGAISGSNGANLKIGLAGETFHNSGEIDASKNTSLTFGGIVYNNGTIHRDDSSSANITGKFVLTEGQTESIPGPFHLLGGTIEGAKNAKLESSNKNLPFDFPAPKAGKPDNTGALDDVKFTTPDGETIDIPEGYDLTIDGSVTGDGLEKMFNDGTTIFDTIDSVFDSDIKNFQYQNFPNGLLKGPGTINGNVDNFGTIDPSSSKGPGKSHIDGYLKFEFSSVFVERINSTNPGGYNQIEVGGAVESPTLGFTKIELIYGSSSKPKGTDVYKDSLDSPITHNYDFTKSKIDGAPSGLQAKLQKDSQGVTLGYSALPSNFNHIAFTQGPPSAVNVGQTFMVKLAIEDSSNNIIKTDDITQILVASDDGTFVTVGTALKGVVTVDFAASKPGTYVLKASIRGHSGQTISSTPIIVKPM
jgi:hypothetical protein